MSIKEVIISDDASSLIDRQDVEQKLQRLTVYLHKVEQRIQALDRKMAAILKVGDKEDLIEQGLKGLKLESQSKSNIK